jgi:hypothetical protein
MMRILMAAMLFIAMVTTFFVGIAYQHILVEVPGVGRSFQKILGMDLPGIVVLGWIAGSLYISIDLVKKATR